MYNFKFSSKLKIVNIKTVIFNNIFTYLTIVKILTFQYVINKNFNCDMLNFFPTVFKIWCVFYTYITLQCRAYFKCLITPCDYGCSMGKCRYKYCASQNVISWLAASASPGNLGEVQIFRPKPRAIESETLKGGSSILCFNKLSRWLRCPINFEHP